MRKQPILLTSLLAFQFAYAKEPEYEAPPLDEVVISVSGYEQKILDTAASVNVVTSSQIHNGQAEDNLSEPLNRVPGIFALNRQNYAQDLLERISKICPMHILIGNHDLYTKSTNEVNTVKLYKYIPNITVYENPTKINFFGKSILMLPWVEKKQDQVNVLKRFSGCDYLFCHSDLNGARMHLTSVAHKNPDKIDVEEFSGFKNVYSGHIHILQVNKNFTFVGNNFE
ncbi:MAG: hypothetical protein EBV54_06025, partial [Burkholderiaceae bacterium]|nr:hypothetical protein [Burkholderiaceae bacterium]